MKTSRIILNALAMASLTLAGMASADEITREGYLTDSRGNVVKSGAGLCWHTGFWTPAMAIEECDPSLVKEEIPVPAKKSAEPEPMAVAPAPKLAAVTPPPSTSQPASRKMIFSVDSSADALFGFGRATLTPVGQQAIDKFATDLKDANFDVITVTGHTDRIGSHAYNMRLSTRRAEVVKTYLVESAGIPADKIAAKGVNGAEPITKPGECKGKKATKKLIACLGPDRRVEVEVTTKQTSK